MEVLHLQSMYEKNRWGFMSAVLMHAIIVAVVADLEVFLASQRTMEAFSYWNIFSMDGFRILLLFVYNCLKTIDFYDQCMFANLSNDNCLTIACLFLLSNSCINIVRLLICYFRIITTSRS